MELQNTPAHREYVARLRSRFADYLLVLEVRHGSWNEPGILDFLESLEIGVCNIEQTLFHRLQKPAAVATSGVGYVRLHGRNYKQWFAEKSAPQKRHDYLYSVDELEPWIERIKAVEHRSRDTYAVTNIHYVRQAVVNAVEISSIPKGHPVPAPPKLVERYPELREIVRDTDEAGARST